jgi:hypothetical protein
LQSFLRHIHLQRGIEFLVTKSRSALPEALPSQTAGSYGQIAHPHNAAMMALPPAFRYFG